MKYKNIDLLALTESRWPCSGVFSVCDSTILHSGSLSSHTHGVAIILSPRAKAVWNAAGCVFQPVSERILRLRLKCHMSYISVVAVYAPINPPNSTSEAVDPSEAFYDQLQSTLSSVPSSDLILILGDFIAHVGSDFSSWNSVIGPHGTEECNENGERLLDFCAGNQLIITNTWFQHKLLHTATWFRNGNRSRTGHMIDHVLVNKRFRTSVLDACVYWPTFHEPDHELVVSTLRFKIKPSVDTQGHHSTKPQTFPLLTRLATSRSWLNLLTSLIIPPPSTLNGTALNHPSNRLVSPFHLHLEVVTLIGSPMKSTTCPGRRKKLGFV